MLVKFLERACYPRNGVILKIRASVIRTSEIRASQGPPVFQCVW